MTKQFLQETNFEEDVDLDMPEQRAKDQILRKRWIQDEEEILKED